MGFGPWAHRESDAIEATDHAHRRPEQTSNGRAEGNSAILTQDRILPVTRTCPLAARTLIGMSSPAV